MTISFGYGCAWLDARKTSSKARFRNVLVSQFTSSLQVIVVDTEKEDCRTQ